jgi:hypothetical protein
MNINLLHYLGIITKRDSVDELESDIIGEANKQ